MEYVISIIKSNPILLAMLSMWGLSMFTFIFRNVPLVVLYFIVKQVTTTVTINNQDNIYYLFLSWVSQYKLNSYIRTYNFSGLTNYGTDDSIFTCGYGKTIITYHDHLILLNRYKTESNATAYSKETIDITILGRNRALFKTLFEDINKLSHYTNAPRVYEFIDHHWRYFTDMQPRNLNSVFLPSHDLKLLINHLDSYCNRKEWYQKYGIPYKTGILLEGPPGTGKTSLVTAICTFYKKHCFILNLQSLNDQTIKQAVAQVPQGEVILIEDIDTYFFDRKISEDKKEIIGCSLGALLNALDGVTSGIDRIIFATTNHPEKLDGALCRPGRFDLRLKFNYFKISEFKQYLHNFYTCLTDQHFTNLELKPEVSPAIVQQCILDNPSSPNKVITTFCNKIFDNTYVKSLMPMWVLYICFIKGYFA